jgi:hypothetical protein
MVHGSSSETESCSDIQDTFCFLWNPSFLFRIKNILPIVSDRTINQYGLYDA